MAGVSIQRASMRQTFSVSGMTCDNCVAKVQSRLQESAHITEAKVTLDPPKAVLDVHHPMSEDEINTWLAALGKYRVGPVDDQASPSSVSPAMPEKSATTYKPLVILLTYLLAVTGIVAWASDLTVAMRIFMAGFFITFSFFKMLDLRGFADAYRSYDLVAKAVPGYGYVYPFLELGLGLAYLANWNPLLVNAATAILMAVSLAGVLKAVLSKQAIRCACLGTVFNLPMSTVTIIEDALMLAMAVFMLILHQG